MYGSWMQLRRTAILSTPWLAGMALDARKAHAHVFDGVQVVNCGNGAFCDGGTSVR